MMFNTTWIWIIPWCLTFLLGNNCLGQARGQTKKTFIEFEREYVERAYIKAEDRLNTRPFDTATKVAILECRDKLSKETILLSKDSLLQKWSDNPKVIHTLDTSAILVLSDILLNTVNVETAYKYAERAYQAYVEDSGFAYGWTWDPPPSLDDFIPSHLILFYDSQGSVNNYIAICFNCLLTDYGTVYFHIDRRLTLSRLKNLFSDLGKNVLKTYY